MEHVLQSLNLTFRLGFKYVGNEQFIECFLLPRKKTSHSLIHFILTTFIQSNYVCFTDEETKIQIKKLA